MDIKEIAKKIENEGGRLYLVGGAVRDELLGMEPHDRDYCVQGIDVETFNRLFPDAFLAGKDFAVFRMEDCEFAFARSEKKVSEGYKGFEIHTSKDVSIEEDLKRRDITINSIAKDVLTEEVIDPFNGKKDLEDGIIRHTSEAFSEDPLRAYRAARFASKFNFCIADDTLTMMAKQRKELATITPERVFEELRKSLESKKPSVFFRVLNQTRLLSVHFPELRALVGQTQPEKYHPEGDAFEHTMVVLDKVAKETNDTSVRFAALVHDLGKGVTPKEELPHHIGHEEKGVEIISQMCDRLRIPTLWKKKGMQTSKYHMLASISNTMRPYKQAVLFNNIARSAIGLDDLEIIVQADNMVEDRKIFKFSKVAKEALASFSGKDLIEEGITPETIGIEQFWHKIYEKQAEKIKTLEKEEQ